MTPLCIQTVPSVLCLMYVMKDAFNGPDCGEWGHLLIIPAKWWQLVMWEELNDSIMHQTLGRFEKKKKRSWQQAQHVWEWKYLHPLRQMSEWMFLKCFLTACALSLPACNLFSHALSVAGSQVRFLIHNEHGRRQSQAKGGTGRGERGWGGGEADNHLHTILCWLQKAKKQSKTGMWVPNTIWAQSGVVTFCALSRGSRLWPLGCENGRRSWSHFLPVSFKPCVNWAVLKC